jgi:hypothetical protein
VNFNLVGLLGAAASLAAFVFTCRRLRRRSPSVRLAWGLAFAVPAIPAALFAVYYFHVLPEWAWFYTLRSWRGSEFLAVFLGCAAGAAASLLPRMLLGLPLFALLALAVIPYVKPVIWPLEKSTFAAGRWDGEACLQSTPSTCGPASVCTVLKRLGANPSEREAAQASFSYAGGTEAWYLARYVRSQGFAVRFVFKDTFAPEVGLPAVVGVRFGQAGHFIAVLDVTGGEVHFADPLRGEERLFAGGVSAAL